MNNMWLQKGPITDSMQVKKKESDADVEKTSHFPIQKEHTTA